MQADNSTHPDINNDAIKVFHALSHLTRLSICTALMKGPQSVSQLCEILDLKQYMVSQQLSVLRSAGVVRFERRSRHMIYSLATPHIANIIHIACNIQVSEEMGNERQKPTREFSSFARIL